MLLKFLREPPWGRGIKAKMVPWPRWPTCPYVVKTFKNLLFQNQVYLVAWSLHKSSGTGSLPKLLKWWSYVDVWPFYGKDKFASYIILYGPYTFIWEKCWEIIFWTSSTWAIFTSFQMGPSVKKGLITCLNGSTPLNKVAAIPIYDKNT